MTPAINTAQKAGIVFQTHQYEHDPSAEAYGEEAAEKLGVPGERVFKTLVVAVSGRELAVAIVPVPCQLDLKVFAKAVGAKKVRMASPDDVERSTGYVLGGVSPLGQKKALPTVIDRSAEGLLSMFVSGGRRGLEIELSPQDLCRLTRGRFADIARGSQDA